MRVSLSLKIALFIIVILALSLVLNSFLNFSNFQKSYTQLVQSRFEVFATDIRRIAEDNLNLGLSLEASTQLDSVLDDFKAEDPDMETLLIFDATGHVVFSTDNSRDGQEVPESWRVFKPVSEKQYAMLEAQNAYVLALPLMNSFNVQVGTLAIEYKSEVVDNKVHEVFESLAKNMGVNLVVFGVLAIIFIYMMLHGLTRNLSVMADALWEEDGTPKRHFDGSELSQRSPELAKDAESFHQTLHTAHSELLEIQEQLTEGGEAKNA